MDKLSREFPKYNALNGVKLVKRLVTKALRYNKQYPENTSSEHLVQFFVNSI